jgi:hypothetical protein
MCLLSDRTTLPKSNGERKAETKSTAHLHDKGSTAASHKSQSPQRVRVTTPHKKKSGSDCQVKKKELFQTKSVIVDQ